MEDGDGRLTHALREAEAAARRGYGLALDHLRRNAEAIDTAERSLGAGLDRLQQSRIQADEMLTELRQQLDETVRELRVAHTAAVQKIGRYENRLDRFSITVFGRTMVGKSTLMEILTRGDGSSIGRGEQRKTRDVRVYRWKGLEITDVPGIGAFEGGEDTRLAMRAAEQADLVLFLITSDAPQPIEAHYLAAVRRLGKPVLGVLNVQYSLETERDVRRLLRDPEKPFDPHRLRELTDQFLAFVRRHAPEVRVDFFPVHLRARFLATRPNYARDAEALLRASRFSELEERLVRELRARGAFDRFRALIDGAAVPTLGLMDRLLYFADRNSSHGRVLIGKRQKLQQWIDRFLPEGRERIEGYCRQAIGRLRDEVPGFVEDHVEDDDVAERWKALVERAGVSSSAKELQQQLHTEAEAQLTEIARELRAELDSVGVLADAERVEAADITDFKRIWNWGVHIVSGGLVIAALALGGPLGWIAAGVGLLGQLFSWFMDDRVEKVRRARERLERKLSRQLERQERELRQNLMKWFHNSVERMVLGVRQQLDTVASAVFDLADAQRGHAWTLNDHAKALHREVVIQALSDGGFAAEAAAISDVARVPGIATMLLIRPGVQVAGEARRRIERALGEHVWFVVDTGVPISLLQQAIGRECSRQNLSIEKRIRVAHAYLEDPSALTRERIRLAQQLVGLHVVVHRSRDAEPFSKGVKR